MQEQEIESFSLKECCRICLITNKNMKDLLSTKLHKGLLEMLCYVINKEEVIEINCDINCN